MMLCCQNIRGGQVAVSCFQNWTPIQERIKTPKMTRSAIIRALLHSYVDPPHCRANNKEMIDGAKSKFPIGSMLLNFSLKLSVLFSGTGKWRAKMTIIIETAPMGRLM